MSRDGSPVNVGVGSGEPAPGSHLYPMGPTVYRMEAHTPGHPGQTVTRGELDDWVVMARPRGEDDITGFGRGIVTALHGDHHGVDRRRERERAVSHR